MPSFRSIIQALQKCTNMKHLKQTHAQTIAAGLGGDSYVLSRILAFCSDPTRGSLGHAHLLFETMPSPTLCVRNTMIRAFLLTGEHAEPFQVYSGMLQDGLRPDNYTLPYLLKACANTRDSRTGAAVHTHALKFGWSGSDAFVSNALVLMYMACGDSLAAREVFSRTPRLLEASRTVMISGYSKLGEIEAARGVFDEAPVRDGGMWGSMISGYVRNNCFKEALSMFRLMQAEGSSPDEGVFVAVLGACARLGAADVGTWIHHYLDRLGFRLSVRLGTALVDMYAKCGNLRLASKLFRRLPQRDTICWNVMIFGLAMHGDGEGAIKLFSDMQTEGIRPDDTTFLAVLTACSHSGAVQEGLNLFKSMRTEHQIEPRSEHYGCIVDFLGRAGLFEEAREIIDGMPASSSAPERAVAWRSLLSACRNHGETMLAEVASERLLEIEEVHSGVYILLSNIYDNSGRHDDARRLRKSMKDRGVTKMPGCSSIELGSCVHEFVAGEEMHPQMGEIYELLGKLSNQLTTPHYSPELPSNLGESTVQYNQDAPCLNYSYLSCDKIHLRLQEASSS